MATTELVQTWTYEDLFTLPDEGKRYEIIAGELYELPTPWSAHATAIMNLLMLLFPTIKARSAMMLTGPIDVFMKDADPVEPDILVLLPDRLPFISKRGIEGPPNLLIEVLCHWNPEHDRILKRMLYARGGVDEYWLVRLGYINDHGRSAELTVEPIEVDPVHLYGTCYPDGDERQFIVDRIEWVRVLTEAEERLVE